MSKSLRAWVWPACASLALAVVSPLVARAQEPQGGLRSEPRPSLAEQKILAALASQSSVKFVDQLANAVPASIEPESWTHAGGQGTISAAGHALALRPTNRIHREIRGFLEALN